ncbi:MAG: BamA/TamA family outer membrane protein [Candidatus Latescibacteria bacterium]|jgi:outer membrane protein insertion porin family|nr:BamA/TamA family outer membrane protein [Candidatus Latescibacterota bacterium]MBT4137917.1 BamA/TamA family outer membrane protein [Candidatus Latescibacterota bacterium]MBT5829949.1 BamA/TamA family outer membrane protein [Candidatus Latescibacterota bacterium]
MRALIIIIVIAALHGLPQNLYAQGGIGHTLEKIEVRGNEKTRAELIRRVLPIEQGTPLREGDLERCTEVLERLSLFRTVLVNAKPGSNKGQAILVVYVQEKRFGGLGLSLEYTELNGFGLSADAHHANLNGTGKVMGAAYTLGERLKRWGFQYTDPLVLKSNQSFHLQVSGSSADRDLYRSSDANVRGRYDLERIGGSLGLGHPSPQRAFRLIFKYAFEAIQVGAFEKPTVLTNGGLFANEIESEIGREALSYVTLELHKQPTTIWGQKPGFNFGARLDISTKAIGSVSNFIRLRTELYRHIQLYPNHMLSLGGRGGLIWGTPPFYERFYLDGENQLRGVDRRDIGPEGGTQFFMAEALYHLRIKPLGSAYAFAEAGGLRRPIPNTNRHQEDTDFSVGIGFLLFNRIDISFGISTGTVIVKSHRFGGINIDL